MRVKQGPNKVIAGPVTKWSEILSDASDMMKMIDEGNFTGRYKEAHALAHAQMDVESPKAFFVVSKEIAKSFGGFRIIANTKIIHKTNPIIFQEACMSFMFRPTIKVKRFDKITIECEIGEGKSTMFDLEGLEAYIVQHELDHAKGINIYHK